MAIAYNNGARQEYGPVDTALGLAAEVRVAGVKNQLVCPVAYNKLPSASSTTSGQDAAYLVIPANSFITAVYGYISTDFNSTSGTTTIDVGLERPDGTDIDTDGLIADWGGAADGSNTGWTLGAGALVGASIGANAAVITMTPSVADLTAGAGVVVVEYIEPTP